MVQEILAKGDSHDKRYTGKSGSINSCRTSVNSCRRIRAIRYDTQHLFMTGSQPPRVFASIRSIDGLHLHDFSAGMAPR